MIVFVLQSFLAVFLSAVSCIIDVSSFQLNVFLTVSMCNDVSACAVHVLCFN